MSQLETTYTKWRKVIATGNDNFALHHTLITLVYYLRAIDLAELLVKSWPLSHCATDALLISYQNLAELYEREGSLRLAWQNLVNVKQRLIALADRYSQASGLALRCQQAHRRLHQFEYVHGSFGNTTAAQTPEIPSQYNDIVSIHLGQPLRR